MGLTPSTRSIAVLLLAFVLVPRPVLAQMPSRIDTIEALSLLREAVAEFEASDDLRTDERFGHNLAFLYRIWGEEWTPPPPPQNATPIEAITDSLVKLGEVDRARELALGQEDETTRKRALAPVLYWMVENGESDRVIALTDSLGDIRSAIIAVLNGSPPDGWRAAVDRISVYLDEASLDARTLEGHWNSVVNFVSRRDFDLALEMARERSVRRSWILWRAAERRHPAADTILRSTYDRVMALPHAADRFAALETLQSICARFRLSACGTIEFPQNLEARRPIPVINRLHRAFGEGRWQDVGAIGDTLRDLVGPERYAILLADRLEGGKRHRGYDSVATAVLTELEAAATAMSQPRADSLDARLAGLWVVWDPGRAWRAVDRIDDAGLQTVALTNLARASYPTRAPVALEALRRGGSGLDLSRLYVQLRVQADSALAREIYGMLASDAERLRAQLGWAEVIRGAGRWSEAHELAFDSLKLWDPTVESPLGWELTVFIKLGSYQELLAWARSRETARGRATALAQIALAARWYRPPGRPIS